MPFIRGRIIPEVELGGRAKRVLDVLLWMSAPSGHDLRALDELEVLRTYLISMRPPVAQIQLWIPQHHLETINALTDVGIEFSVVPAKLAGDEIKKQLKSDDPEISDAVSTAQMVDADCLVTNHAEWFPFIEEVEKLLILITDCGFLLRYAEVFVRGHDIPWSFECKVWNQSWATFYPFTEQRTFKPGFDLLQRASLKRTSVESQETGQSLVYSRISNLCFTRDRLQFYVMQRLAARRNGRRRQDFSFEIPYYLNVYYLLIYGGFDHAALFVSQLLGLGLDARQVGATYRGFLERLKAKSPAIHAVFISDANRQFIERIGALRHFAAHRGSITPSKVVEKLDQEPTDVELDADIKASGRDELEAMLPEGKVREGFRAMARAVARAERYEKNTILEDIVPVELEGKFCLIHPLVDTEWNFSRTIGLLNEIFNTCSDCI